MHFKLDVVAPLRLDELVDLLLRLALGVEVGVDVTVATLVRRQRQGCWNVYSIATVGQVRPQRTIGQCIAAARVDAHYRDTI